PIATTCRALSSTISIRSRTRSASALACTCGRSCCRCWGSMWGMVSKPVTFRSISRSVLLISVAACGAAHTPQQASTADVVLVGGDVKTMDPAHPHATAVAYAGDAIVAVGDDLKSW